MEIKIQESVEGFISSLKKETIAKMLRTIDLLEEFGPRLGMPHSKSMGKGLFELRVRGKSDVRIFYCFHKNTAVLLHGFIKKSQQTPRKELRVAQRLKQALDRL